MKRKNANEIQALLGFEPDAFTLLTLCENLDRPVLRICEFPYLINNVNNESIRISNKFSNAMVMVQNMVGTNAKDQFVNAVKVILGCFLLNPLVENERIIEGFIAFVREYYLLSLPEEERDIYIKNLVYEALIAEGHVGINNIAEIIDDESVRNAVSRLCIDEKTPFRKLMNTIDMLYACQYVKETLDFPPTFTVDEDTTTCVFVQMVRDNLLARA